MTISWARPSQTHANQCMLCMMMIAAKLSRARPDCLTAPLVLSLERVASDDQAGIVQPSGMQVLTEDMERDLGDVTPWQRVHQRGPVLT